MNTPMSLKVVVVALAIMGVGASASFYFRDPANDGFLLFPTMTMLHIIPGGIFLALAPFQFSKKIRSQAINYHRWAGRFLVFIGLVAGVGALFLAWVVPYSGLPEIIVNGFFGLFFIFALVNGILLAFKGQISQHREWMLRAFAIGLSIATMRLIFIPALIFTGGPTVEQAQTLSIVAFTLSFAIHSGFAEYWIRKTRGVQPVPQPQQS